MSGRANISDIELLLYLSGTWTNLPEIYDYCGSLFRDDSQMQDKAFLLFIDRFAGMVLTVPSRDKVKKWIRNINIYIALRAARGSRVIGKELARKYKISEDHIYAMYKKIKEQIKVLLAASKITEDPNEENMNEKLETLS